MIYRIKKSVVKRYLAFRQQFTLQREGRSKANLLKALLWAATQKNLPLTRTEDTGKEIPPNVFVNYPLTKRFFERLEWADANEPEVSIVIPFYPGPDLALNLVRSIWLNTADFRYEIILIDNGSPVGTHLLPPKYADRVRYLRLNHSQYVGDAYNIGVENARAAFVVLMNNNIVVEPGWLGPLISPLRNDESIGATGPRFLYPEGTLQEAGARIRSDGTSEQSGNGCGADDPQYNTGRDVDYCTGATIAVRRDDYIECLGYDWTWSPGYLEDADLCFKLKARGLRACYVPESTVFRIESTTMPEKPPPENIQEVIDANRQAFVTKWGHLIGKPPGDDQRPARTTEANNLSRFRRVHGPIGKGEPTVGIYFPYEFIPGGGEKFALSIAETLSGNATPVFIFEGTVSLLRVISVVTDLGFPAMDFRYMTVDEATAAAPFDIFILIGNQLFPQMAGLGGKNFFVCQFPFPTPESTLKKLYDAGHYRTFDSYIVYSMYAKHHVDRIFASRKLQPPKIEVLYPTAEDVGESETFKFDQIIGVGRFFVDGHNKRQDIMIDAFAEVRRANPKLDARMILAGACHKGPEHRRRLLELRKQASALPVRFEVDIPRDRLNELYNQSKVYLHAAGWGVDENNHPERAEHFGITVVEAMFAGCVPIVFNLGGPLEIVQPGKTGFVVNTIEELASMITYVLERWDTDEIIDMKEQAKASAAEKFGRDAFNRRLFDLIPPDRETPATIAVSKV